mmetsp:Transcript_11446/g.29036  ORF Transcript_11446/g.29036 Transcript_11446/m.29036 type:complete len:214 (-) Transcript_11446:699-1340(-)
MNEKCLCLRKRHRSNTHKVALLYCCGSRAPSLVYSQALACFLALLGSDQIRSDQIGSDLFSSPYSLQSETPSFPMANWASLSARHGEEMILTTRDSPLPFLNQRRVVVECAMMLPPMALMEGPANMPPPSRLAATTWFVTTTATPNSSASRCSDRRNRPRWIWRTESSPRPLNSLRYKLVALSTTISAKRASAIMEAAATSSCAWCSVLCARA